MIPEEIVEQVRDSADLVAIIGEAVELKRTGSDYRGPCPFHGGTHRNFAVIPKKGRYYCFVCHESGDVFSWLMKRLGMDYPTAVREVARQVGITIPEGPGRAGPDPLEPLFGAVAAAQDWFTRQLLELADAKAAREYLAGRDLPVETAALYGLGFAPQGRAFLAAMAELGIEERVLLEAGLAAQCGMTGPWSPDSVGGCSSRFTIFAGALAGFGGRLLGPGEPKYLNSPENPIFHKGRQLYNLHQAKGAIRKGESVILVEGYFDVLPAGARRRGARGGAARHGAHAGPGRAAPALRSRRHAPLRQRSGRAPRHLPRRRRAAAPRHAGAGRDDAAGRGSRHAGPIGRRGRARAASWTTRWTARAEDPAAGAKGWFEGVEHQRDALDRLLPTIRAAADPIMRDLYLKKVSERTGVSREVLQEQAARPGSGSADRQPPAPEARYRARDVPCPVRRSSAAKTCERPNAICFAC